MNPQPCRNPTCYSYCYPDPERAYAARGYCCQTCDPAYEDAPTAYYERAARLAQARDTQNRSK